MDRTEALAELRESAWRLYTKAFLTWEEHFSNCDVCCNWWNGNDWIAGRSNPCDESTALKATYMDYLERWSDYDDE
jgi:hypothetical protein